MEHTLRKLKEKIILILINLLICPFYLFSQAQIIISKPRLTITESKLTIEYDILNSQPTDTLKVWIEVTDIEGNIINATSLSGDFGDRIIGGMNRKIIWDLKQDNIIISKEIYVDVMAEIKKIPEALKESTSVETALTSKAKPISKGNMVVSSLILPGWGQSKVKVKKPFWLIGVAAYGCIAGSITFNRLGVSNYKDYLTSTDYNEIEAIYDKAVKQDKISEYLAYSAIGLWTTNLIWVLITPRSPNQQIVFHKLKNFKIKSGYDPYSNTTLLTLSYQF